MAYPTYPGTPPPSARPKTVTIAGYLLYAVAGLTVIAGILSLVTVSSMSKAITDSVQGSGAEAVGGVIVGVTVVSGVIQLLVATGFALLAYFNNKGRNGSRITTWVIGGLGACCCGLNAASGAFSSSLQSMSNAGSTPADQEAARRIEEAVPPGLAAASTIVAVLVTLCLLGTIILLALPASQPYFRPAAQSWEPPVGYPGGYPQPGQPPYAGEQPYPGQQPYAGERPYPGQQPGTPPYPPAGDPYAPGYPPPGPTSPGEPSAPPPAPPSASPPAPPSAPAPDDPDRPSSGPSAPPPPPA